MKQNEIIKAFDFRHACKKFDDTKLVSKEDFDVILESARLSPSSFGYEPWHFLIVQDKALKEQLRTVFWGGQGQIPTCSYFVICLVKKSFFMRYDSDFIDYMNKEVQKLPAEVIKMKSQFYEKFQKEDFKLLRSEEAMTEWATHQTYIPLANMMTVAAMLGVDSCPMEGFDRDLAEKMLAEKCGVDFEKYGLAYGVAFGYRIDEPFPKTRQKMEDITTWI